MSEHSTAMVVAQPQAMMMRQHDTMFHAEQEAMIREMYAPTATELEFSVLIATARARRLHPILGQIHFVKRSEKQRDGSYKDKWSCQVSIDGLRSKAEETGLYDGQDEPEYFTDADDEQMCARVRVYKKGISRPFIGVARWNEFVQTFGQGDRAQPTRMWSQMPKHMLGKCAEALAFRKAFPEQLGGLYTSEEMGQAGNGDGRSRVLPARQVDDPAHKALADEVVRDAQTADGAALQELLERAEALPVKVRGVGVLAVFTRLLTVATTAAEVDDVESLALDRKVLASWIAPRAEKRRASFAVPTATDSAPAA